MFPENITSQFVKGLDYDKIQHFDIGQTAQVLGYAQALNQKEPKKFDWLINHLRDRKAILELMQKKKQKLPQLQPPSQPNKFSYSQIREKLNERRIRYNKLLLPSKQSKSTTSQEIPKICKSGLSPKKEEGPSKDKVDDNSFDKKVDQSALTSLTSLNFLASSFKPSDQQILSRFNPAPFSQDNQLHQTEITIQIANQPSTFTKKTSRYAARNTIQKGQTPPPKTDCKLVYASSSNSKMEKILSPQFFQQDSDSQPLLYKQQYTNVATTKSEAKQSKFKSD